MRLIQYISSYIEQRRAKKAKLQRQALNLKLFCAATSSPDVSEVQRLIALGADVNAKIVGFQGASGINSYWLENAALLGGKHVHVLAGLRTGMLKLIEVGTLLHLVENADVVVILTKAGADPNARDRNGATPLHRAKCVRIIQHLIEAGADVCAQDGAGTTPLHHAYDTACVQKLLEAGADPLTRDKCGRRPSEMLHGGQAGNQIVEILRAAESQASLLQEVDLAKPEPAIEVQVRRF